MDQLLADLARAIQAALQQLALPQDMRRFTREICESLAESGPILANTFGPEMVWRYSGCERGKVPSLRRDGRPFRVIEYLWDVSISKYCIPEAIADPNSVAIGGRYELLLVAESELGTPNEICRDLLKLLDARTRIRCLVYKQPATERGRRSLEQRFIRVLHNHEYFVADPGRWLFVALNWRGAAVQAQVTTLNNNRDGFVPI